MNDRPTTIQDIARALNVSLSTVSRALRGHPDVKAETKNKVLELAKKMNYYPDFVAQGLRRKKSQTIGVIVPEIKHDFFSSAIDGIDDVAYHYGYTVVVCKTNEDYQREKLSVSSMLSNRTAGLLVSISQTTTDKKHFDILRRTNTPVVFFDRVFNVSDINVVVGDDYGGAVQAVEHLVQKGYKKIAHLAGPAHLWNSQERYRGYRSVLEKYNLPLDSSLVVRGWMHEKDGKTGIQALLKLKERPDAVFATNDPVAIGAFGEIKKNGLTIPDDIALIGFTGSAITALIDPPLSTVSLSAYLIGKTAAELLFEQLNSDGGTVTTPQKRIIKTKLIVRAST